ncbi:MAG TPA: phosphopantothenoylcysteine decarboxylase [Phycisphaerales bacterium]
MDQRILITAGPTHEPIDAVRFLGNRSSGKLGIALAREALARGADVTLLLGPVCAEAPAGVRTSRFRTTSDLQALLKEHGPSADVVIMAAAVADYRPKAVQTDGKIKRAAAGLTLELEATPDLLAELGSNRREGQRLIGFALEPRDRLVESAKSKLERKRVDAIVANELETMDAETIRATVFTKTRSIDTPGMLHKTAFAPWLLDVIAGM